MSRTREIERQRRLRGAFERRYPLLDALDARFDVTEPSIDGIEPRTHFGRKRADLGRERVDSTAKPIETGLRTLGEAHRAKSVS